MTPEGEKKLLSDMEDVKKALAMIVEELRRQRSIFSSYDQMYNEEILKNEGHVPR